MIGPQMPHSTTSFLTNCGSRNHSECAHSIQPHTPTIATIAPILTTSRKVSPAFSGASGGMVIGVIAAIWKNNMIRAASAMRQAPPPVCRTHAMLLQSRNGYVKIRAPDSAVARHHEEIFDESV